MALTTLFALVAFTILAAVQAVDNMTEIGQGFFITVATCWAVLIPAKLWSGHRGDSGLRRVIMMILGCGLGLGAYWLEGRPMPFVTTYGPTYEVLGQTTEIPLVASYLSYFGLALFAVRWWKLADRHRHQRFSFAPDFGRRLLGFCAVARGSLGPTDPRTAAVGAGFGHYSAGQSLGGAAAPGRQTDAAALCLRRCRKEVFP
jgi:hypothetical protein